MINFLSKRIPIHCIYNLRGEENSGTLDPDTNEYLPLFSAGEFLHLLWVTLNASSSKKGIEDVEEVKTQYLKQRVLFHRKRRDASTKQALFDVAWKHFIDQKLWLRLNLITFSKGA